MRHTWNFSHLTSRHRLQSECGHSGHITQSRLQAAFTLCIISKCHVLLGPQPEISHYTLVNNPNCKRPHDWKHISRMDS